MSYKSLKEAISCSVVMVCNSHCAILRHSVINSGLCLIKLISSRLKNNGISVFSVIEFV